MVCITGVEISSELKCAKQTAISRTSKHFKCDIHRVRNVENDGLNYVHHWKHGGHHQSRNFVKVKMCKRNWNLETFQNTVNAIYTVCAMSKIMV